MKKIVITIAAVAAVSLSTAAARAGGWGSGFSHGSMANGNGVSSGLLNLSPSIGLGNVKLLNGISVLNGSPILSGNGILSGVLSGIGVSGILSGNNNRNSGRTGHGGHHRR
jgi:hypothetical protein